MKKFLLFLTVAAVVAISNLTGPLDRVYAGGGLTILGRISASANSATIGGSISFNVFLFTPTCLNTSTGYRTLMSTPYCPDGYTDYQESGASQWPVNIIVSGSGNTISPTASTTTDSSGNAQFTLSSSVAEAKTITVKGNADPFVTTVVNFVAPAPASAPAASAKTTKTSSAAAPAAAPAATPQPPAAPSTESFEIAGKQIGLNKPIVLQQDQKFTLSGKTVPNGVVTLTVHSKPQTTTVTADSTGYWKYELNHKLEAGNHYIEASVTDPATHIASPTVKLASFSVKLAAAKSVNGASSKKVPSRGSNIFVPVILGILIIATGVGAWFAWRRQKNGGSSGIIQPYA